MKTPSTDSRAGRSSSPRESPALGTYSESAGILPPIAEPLDKKDGPSDTQASPVRLFETFRIAYDVTLRRPGCVLLQAVMGCAVPNFQLLFPSESWLVSPTDDMKAYRATREELDRLSEITARRIA